MNHLKKKMEQKTNKMNEKYKHIKDLDLNHQHDSLLSKQKQLIEYAFRINLMCHLDQIISQKFNSCFVKINKVSSKWEMAQMKRHFCYRY